MTRHLLTGAGSGIGAALAAMLAARGDDLVLLARSAARAESLQAQFPGAQVLVADLADPGTLNGLGREVQGGLDSLVHVAGVVHLGEVARMRLHDFEEQVAVNLISPTVLTREFLPHVREVRGTVLFVNSTAGLSASASWGAYAASKFGLRAVAESLRAEEAEHGVRVTTLFPSRTATPMQASVHEQEGVAYDPSAWMSAESVAATLLHVLDLPGDAVIPDVTIRSSARARPTT